MKIEVLQENLSYGVGAVSRMVTGKAQLVVLNNILLTNDKGKLKLSGTNLETGMNLWLGGKIEGKGKITVPAKVFLELVNSLPKETVELTMEGDKLKVKCGKYKAVVNGIGADEFPEVPSLKGGKKKNVAELVMKKKVLEDVVEQVALAAGTDEARPVFTGVKMEIKKASLRMAATDGYRLSVKKIKGLKGQGKEREMVVPARALVELTKSAGQAKGEEVMMAAVEEEKQLIMALDDLEVVTRLLEGDFPDFDKIIPTVKGTTIELETEELQQAVRVASIFARDSANIVRFKINNKGLSISANAPQVGENEVGLSGTVRGEEAEIAFNSRYLMEMLANVKAEKMNLEITGPLNPGVFKISGDDSWLHIIMPVRVQGE